MVSVCEYRGKGAILYRIFRKGFTDDTWPDLKKVREGAMEIIIYLTSIS